MARVVGVVVAIVVVVVAALVVVTVGRMLHMPWLLAMALGLVLQALDASQQQSSQVSAHSHGSGPLHIR